MQDICAQLEWGSKKLGKLVDIVKPWPGLEPAIDPWHVTVVSTSLKSIAAQSMYAREKLKELLPRRL